MDQKRTCIVAWPRVVNLHFLPKCATWFFERRQWVRMRLQSQCCIAVDLEKNTSRDDCNGAIKRNQVRNELRRVFPQKPRGRRQICRRWLMVTMCWKTTTSNITLHWQRGTQSHITSFTIIDKMLQCSQKLRQKTDDRHPKIVPPSHVRPQTIANVKSSSSRFAGSMSEYERSRLNWYSPRYL